MKKSDFDSSPAGHLVPTEKSQWAFIPNPLPPTLEMAAIASKLAHAAQRVGELSGIGRTLANPYLLIQPLQVQEALTSSSMEGTYTTVDDLLLLEAGAPERNRAAETREVLNYRFALADAIASLNEVPLSLRTLKNAHQRLLRGVHAHRGAKITAGELKEHQNFIGAYEIEKARFIPAPPMEARKALEELELYIQRDVRGPIPDLIDAALIHYQFETIHPFADGNGRVGRMLITLHLIMRGVISEPLLYLSPVLEARKDEYIDRMYEVSRFGRWTEWINFFLDVVAETSERAIRIAEALLSLQKAYRLRVSQAGRSANLHRIVEHLFERQVVTIPSVAQFLGVTYRSAQLNIESLVQAGVLHEVQGTSNPKYFLAKEVRDIIT